ncbi:hypothetical protein LOK49_LG10G01076 [Camellia lanceoleosa]|uniref:Uncharacterized protein n=1 Tax=Camellia lanceoleosa TaxID=1840588 RepID=A0ACC0G9S5_9ERIC|nr:hypothetical protein LOK49_LG10G01076 [Camellia lanceoleosa]
MVRCHVDWNDTFKFLLKIDNRLGNMSLYLRGDEIGGWREVVNAFCEFWVSDFNIGQRKILPIGCKVLGIAESFSWGCWLKFALFMF